MSQLIEEILSKMTLDEKAELCAGKDSLSIEGLPELGIGQFNMHDGPQGLRFEDGRSNTALPCGMSLSCTFDQQSAEDYGALIGRECNATDVHSILGPSFNLMRTPLNGRNFEYYGEDPVLSGRIASGYVRGCQKQKVAGTPKHLALNNQEICRTTGDSRVSERALQELYLRSFEIVTKEAHPWMMMSSYNKINGTHASACGHVQEELAKDTWGFDGVMVSDWGGAHEPEGCALGGLDLEMGSRNCFGPKLAELVRSGKVPMSVLDEKVRRLLRLMERTGVLKGGSHPAGETDTEWHHQIVRRLATEGMVLLKNEGSVLPLKKSELKTLAVIGPSAAFEHHKGGLENCGGSGAVHPAYEVTPLAGIQEFCGEDVKVVYAPGVRFESECVLSERHFPGGLRCEFFEEWQRLPEDGDRCIEVQTLKDPNCSWGQFLAAGLENDWALNRKPFGVRVTGTLVPDRSGKILVSLNSARAGARLYLDGKLISEVTMGGFPAKGATVVELVAGKPVDFKLLARRYSKEFAEIKVLWQDDASVEMERAVELARHADAVLFVGGTTHRYDREAIGWGDVPNADIPDLELPDGQNEMIQKLTEVNDKVIVALVNGSVMNVEPWIDRVAGLLECWYPGMEAGHALADVLFGEREPGGRLNCTWARNLMDYACHANGSYPGVRGEDNPYVTYPEGIFIGYRHFDRAKIQPRFPFGFGLGYTTMEAKLLKVEVREDDLAQERAKVTVTAQVTNTGKREGAAVLQLYVGDDECSVERPVKELEAFRKVRLMPGETQEVEFTLNYRDFAFYSEKLGHFTVEPGTFTVSLGTSSRDLVGSQTIRL